MENHNVPEAYKTNPEGNRNPYMNEQSVLHDLLRGPKVEKPEKMSPAEPSHSPLGERGATERQLARMFKEEYDRHIHMKGGEREDFAYEVAHKGERVKDKDIGKNIKRLTNESKRDISNKEKRSLLDRIRLLLKFKSE